MIDSDVTKHPLKTFFIYTVYITWRRNGVIGRSLCHGWSDMTRLMSQPMLLLTTTFVVRHDSFTGLGDIEKQTGAVGFQVQVGHRATGFVQQLRSVFVFSFRFHWGEQKCTSVSGGGQNGWSCITWNGVFFIIITLIIYLMLGSKC